MEHRALIEILRGLLGRLDADGEVRVRAHELDRWPEGALVALADAGLLVRGTNERGLVCDGCEEACWLLPERFVRPDGAAVLVAPCTGRNPDVHGTLTFPPERLTTWRLDPSVLCALVASDLGLHGPLDEVVAGQAWSLGAARIGGVPWLVFFATSLARPEHVEALRARIGQRAALVLVPRRPTALGSIPVVALDQLVLVRDERMVVDVDLLALALPEPGPMLLHDAPMPAFRAAPGTTWAQVKVWLVDGDTVRIVLPGQPPRSFTAAELGLTNARSRDRRRTKGWAILEALCDAYGTCSWHVGGIRSYDAFKVQVSNLAKALRAFVGIDDSPFHPTSSKHGLRSIFEAGPLPEPEVYVGEDRWGA